MTVMLTVGVTGHRHRPPPGAEREALLAVLGRTMDELDRLIRAAGLLPRLVSGLAAGADCWVASAALERGWRLDVVLPMPFEVYRADFDDEELTVARQSLAAATAVMVLPESAVAEESYERAARIMLDQSDFLIALWDGAAARGRGGTGQVVLEAAARHLPILHLDTTARRAPSLLWSGFDPHGLARTGIGEVTRAPLDRLPSLVAELSAPLAVRPDQKITAPPARLAFAYPLLLAITGVKRLSRSDFRRVPVANSAQQLLTTVLGNAQRGSSFGRLLERVLVPRFAVADSTAVAFVRLYRHSFVANFALAAIAVLLALSSPLFPEGWRPLFSATEILVIAAILLATRRGRRRDWHGGWLRQRYAAERLRCLALSSQLGDLDLKRGDDAPALATTAHELGLPAITIERPYLQALVGSAVRLLEDQIAYHRANARRMRTLEHRLHAVGTVLFGLTALACLALLLFKLAKLATHAPLLAAAETPVLELALLISAGVPAIGAAIYGIRMQGDFGGIAARADQLVEQLERLRLALQSPLQTALGQEFDELRQLVRHAADVMSQELGGWRAAHGARPLTLPG